jgi:hypothetical protein
MNEFFLVVVGSSFIASDFLTFLALVKDDVSAGFDL